MATHVDHASGERILAPTSGTCTRWRTDPRPGARSRTYWAVTGVGKVRRRGGTLRALFAQDTELDVPGSRVTGNEAISDPLP